MDKTEIEKKFLPCPFCGEVPYISKLSMVGIKVFCKNDCVTMPPRFDGGFTSRESAMKSWNTRNYQPINGIDLIEKDTFNNIND